MSDTEVLEDDLVDDDEEAAEDSEFDVPVKLLKDVSQKLLSGGIPAKPARIESLFSHIQGVVAELVEKSFDKLNSALEAAAEANEALSEHGDVDEFAQAYLDDFQKGREHIEDGLDIMRETFFSAKNLEDLKDHEEEFKEAEVQLAEGLSRLEQAVTKAEDPKLFNLHKAVESEHIEIALTAFEIGLEELTAHLEDGDRDHLERVMDQLEVIRNQIELAYELSEKREERIAAGEEDEDDEFVEDDDDFDEDEEEYIEYPDLDED